LDIVRGINVSTRRHRVYHFIQRMHQNLMELRVSLRMTHGMINPRYDIVAPRNLRIEARLLREHFIRGQIDQRCRKGGRSNIDGDADKIRLVTTIHQPGDFAINNNLASCVRISSPHHRWRIRRCRFLDVK
jgi:hypothetical protein